MGKVNALMREFKYSVDINQEQSKHDKLSMFTLVFVSIFISCCKSWTIAKRERSEAQNENLQKVSREIVSQAEKILNTEIQKSFSIKLLLVRIEELLLHWFVYVSRMRQERFICRILFTTSTVKNH